MELLAFLALVERLVSVVRPERPDSKVLQVSVVSLVLVEPLAQPERRVRRAHLALPASAEDLVSAVLLALRGLRVCRAHLASVVPLVSVAALDQTALLGHPVSVEPLVLRERQEHLGTVAHRAPVTCSHQHQPFSLERA